MKDLLDNILGVLLIPLCFGVAGIVWWIIFRNIEINLWPLFSFLLLVLPIFLPFVLYIMTYDRWMEFVRTQFFYKNDRAVLRIKLPNEVFKSPEAMESVFSTIAASGNPDNLWEAYIDGKHALPITCEAVSIGGDVRFYMTVHRKIKNHLEAALYSQYPGIEVEEEPVDYAAEVLWKEGEMDLISFHVVKKNDDVLPIKTYIEFGHDKMPKEEEKYEPMTPMVEMLSQAKPHERIFIQIVCVPHRKHSFKLGYRGGETPTWEKAGKAKINELLQRDDKGKALSGEEETESRPTVSMGERDTATAIERNVSKLAYVTGIRTMYITLDATQFDATKIAPLFNSFRPFNMIGRNELSPRWKTDLDYKWFQDFSGTKVKAMRKAELEQYKLRVYDAGTGKTNAGHQPKVMSVEELASIFHIPGRSVLTPGLGRIPSTRATAPGNLPVDTLPQ